MESDSICSIATDSQNISTTSAAITLTVTASVTQIYYIHTDHLDTPRLITDSNNAKVWEWHNDDPFANNVPNDDPNNTGSHFEYNPRLSGQYYDKETGLFYNWNRFYNPATGRYDQSDLIGLAAGVNTYGYVNASPIRFYDPLGLWSTEGHNFFIKEQFPNLSPELRAQLEAGSAFADNPVVFQGADSSYMHAESSSRWPKNKAQQRMCKFIQDKLKKYRLLKSAGLNNEAYFQLGMGLHPIMDSTSPAHRGLQTFSPFSLRDLINHGGNLPLLPSMEDVDTAKKFRDETVEMMTRAINGDLSGCGCQ